jgi:hypothetical protein
MNNEIRTISQLTVVKPSILLHLFELEKESREKLIKSMNNQPMDCGEVVCLSSFV